MIETYPLDEYQINNVFIMNTLSELRELCRHEVKLLCTYIESIDTIKNLQVVDLINMKGNNIDEKFLTVTFNTIKNVKSIYTNRKQVDESIVNMTINELLIWANINMKFIDCNSIVFTYNTENPIPVVYITTLSIRLLHTINLLLEKEKENEEK